MLHINNWHESLPIHLPSHSIYSVTQRRHHWLQFNFFLLKKYITITSLLVFFQLCTVRLLVYFSVWFESILFDLIECYRIWANIHKAIYFIVKCNKKKSSLLLLDVTICRWFKLVSKTNLWYTGWGNVDFKVYKSIVFFSLSLSLYWKQVKHVQIALSSCANANWSQYRITCWERERVLQQKRQLFRYFFCCCWFLIYCVC